MPPRYAYWTIILEGAPTAFRAHTQDDLLPTLKQLQARHPDAVMKWFARGRLWHSPEEERMAAALKRRPPSGTRRPPDWRPGGEHRDPRDRFKVPRDERRRRFAEKLRHERPVTPPAPREPDRSREDQARPSRPDRNRLGQSRPSPRSDRNREGQSRPSPRPDRNREGQGRPSPRPDRRGDAPRADRPAARPAWKRDGAPPKHGPGGRPPRGNGRGPGRGGGRGGGQDR